MCTGPHDFIPAENTAKLELIYTLYGQRVENVLHFQSSDGWNSAALTNLANEAITSWDTNIAGHTSDDVALVLVRATDVSVDDGVGVEIAPAVATTGDIAQPSLPGNVTVSTKFSGGYTGRSRRGRAYFVGIPANAIDGNALGAGIADTINDGWINFFHDVNHDITGDPRHVIVSYCGGGDWRTDALITEVTQYHTDNNLDSQRRRLNERGQ